MRKSVLYLWLLLSVQISCLSHKNNLLSNEDKRPFRQTLQEEAQAIEPLIESSWVREFTRQTDKLPVLKKKTLYRSADRSTVLIEEEFQRLAAAQKDGFKRIDADEELLYIGRYGTPLAYARALDLAAKFGLEGLRGRRVLDFGFGAPGQLVLMAALGATVVGVDPDPVLGRALVDFPSSIEGGGQIFLHFGKFPAQEKIRAAIGNGYHLFLAKNVIKRGYLHPSRPAPAWQLMDFGVSDEEFARAVFEILEPGGLSVIYNLYPAQLPPDKGYIPWADGQTGIEQEVWRQVGFEVLVFDKDDTDFARVMARALGWDKGEDAMDIDHDLFAIYTVLRKPIAR